MKEKKIINQLLGTNKKIITHSKLKDISAAFPISFPTTYLHTTALAANVAFSRANPRLNRKCTKCNVMQRLSPACIYAYKPVCIYTRSTAATYSECSYRRYSFFDLYTYSWLYTLCAVRAPTRAVSIRATIQDSIALHFLRSRYIYNAEGRGVYKKFQIERAKKKIIIRPVY